MSIFYCRLSSESKQRVYQFSKSKFISRKNKEYQFQEIVFERIKYQFCFQGKLINKEKGILLLKQKGIKTANVAEYLIALYKYFNKDLMFYISDHSFLLIDDVSNVFIYSGAILYYARELEKEIHISSHKEYINQSRVFELKGNSSLSFFNNNLKTV